MDATFTFLAGRVGHAMQLSGLGLAGSAPLPGNNFTSFLRRVESPVQHPAGPDVLLAQDTLIQVCYSKATPASPDLARQQYRPEADLTLKEAFWTHVWHSFLQSPALYAQRLPSLAMLGF